MIPQNCFNKILMLNNKIIQVAFCLSVYSQSLSCTKLVDATKVKKLFRSYLAFSEVVESLSSESMSLQVSCIGFLISLEIGQQVAKCPRPP